MLSSCFTRMDCGGGIGSLPRSDAPLYVGILGGSFDPPHSGHVLITNRAINNLGLDYVVWLVTPQNPFKQHKPADLDVRVEMCRKKVSTMPRVIVTDIESRISTVQTSDTLFVLSKMYPSIRFVWLMGSDNISHFHKWDRWDSIVENIPIAIFPRGNSITSCLGSVMFRRFSRWRVPNNFCRHFFRRRKPCWVFLTDGPRENISSTEIRKGLVLP